MKALIRKLINPIGYDIVKFKKDQTGKNPFQDIKDLFKTSTPLIFDIGANEGQSINILKFYYPDCKIYSFEPSPSTFRKLKENAEARFPEVKIFNCGIGSSEGKLNLYENSHSDMSSFLPLSQEGWGQIQKETSVDIKSIDQFCREHSIEKIDLLKSDTQGFELEVFKGAEQMMKEGKIGMIFFEVIFSDMYKNLPSLPELYTFLLKNDFLMVSIYDLHYQNKIAGWGDLLFVHRSYLK